MSLWPSMTVLLNQRPPSLTGTPLDSRRLRCCLRPWGEEASAGGLARRTRRAPGSVMIRWCAEPTSYLSRGPVTGVNNSTWGQ